MTKEELLKRKELLQQSVSEQKKLLEQAKANLLATDGALQEVEYWLSNFDKENEDAST